MDDVDDLTTIDVPAPGGQPAISPPSDELTDEDLDVVVGGLGRPWIALRVFAE